MRDGGVGSLDGAGTFGAADVAADVSVDAAADVSVAVAGAESVAGFAAGSGDGVVSGPEDAEDVRVVPAASAAPSASAPLALRDRPNAFRRRVRMPMCATLRVS
ncbi:hypothetical protein GCM10010451_59870 [Streptomyces virens]|uniref:Uncharacterized protein n=1 Tax=Streptomyces virens TaxID=285572 RepID=A0ABP6Q2B2_9ACTN